MSQVSDHVVTARAIAATGRQFYSRSWSVGTSSNYSVVVARDPLELLITASGKDKGALGDADFVLVDQGGHAIDPPHARPSAETLLHTTLAIEANAGAILHTHSVWGTLLSDLYSHDGALYIEGYEMLKGLEGIRTHEHRHRVDIFENNQDMLPLVQQLRSRLRDTQHPLQHGFLLRNHGLYAWGKDLAEARRHVEIFEFLFEVLGRKLMLRAAL